MKSYIYALLLGVLSTAAPADADARQKPRKAPAPAKAPASAAVSAEVMWPSSAPALPYQPTLLHDDEPAQPIASRHCTIPEYPKVSLRNEETGRVQLGFKIGADGMTQELKVLRSSGFRELDKAAAHAYRTCKFRPALFDGKAIPGYAQINYIFTLD